MAGGSSSKRKSRKRRSAGSAPRAVRSARRELQAERVRERPRPSYQRRPQGAMAMLGKEGERPAGLFGPVPVSELAILAGIVGAVVGFVNGGGPALIVGIIVCALGVIELTAREHFSGFRSHTTLLAAVPAIVLEAILALEFGLRGKDAPLLAPVVPVFLVSFWLLRRRFVAARQRRIAGR
jgi:hypothetical protein